MSIKIHKHIKTAAKIIFSLACLVFVLYKIDTNALIDVLKKVNLFYLFIALLFLVLSKWISTFRLNRFLGATNIHISNKFNIKLYLLGMFYNLFLPGGIGGDGYKIYLLSKRFSVKAKNVFWAILLDRVMGLLALFCLAAGLSIFIPLPEFYRNYVYLLIPIALGSYYIFIKFLFPRYLSIFSITLGQSFLVQISQIAIAIFILFSIGVFDQTQEYVFIFLISSIVAAIPLTIGGIGSRELTFMVGAGLLNLDVSNSVALALLYYIITVIVSSTGIYYSIRSDKLK